MSIPVKMTDQKPYLLRAMWEWLVANGTRPHIVVNVQHSGVICPAHLKQTATMLFNIADAACPNLQMTDTQVSGNMRFGGKAHAVIFPMDAIVGITTVDAPGTGLGMMFVQSAPVAEVSIPHLADAAAQTPAIEEPLESQPTPEAAEKSRPAWLKVVK